MTDRSTRDDVPPGAGSPRLVQAAGGQAVMGSDAAEGVQHGYPLDKDSVTLGSGDTQDIRLAGLESAHGEVLREPDGDEFVYVHVGRSGTSQVNGAVVTRAALHHGDRLTLGDWTLVFQRDEFADHGRPDAGRQGGDFAGGTNLIGGGEATEARQ